VSFSSNVWLFVMQSLIRALPDDGHILFAHKLAKPLKDIYILKGYDAVGEERRSQNGGN